MSSNQPPCPVPFDGPPTSLTGLVERFFRRCVEDLTRVNAPKQSKCSAGLRDSLARFGIQLQAAPPVTLEGCLVAQSNSVSRLEGTEQQGPRPPSNSTEPDFPLWLCPGHIRPGQVTRFPTSPDLIYVDIDGQETIFFRNASNPCANQDQLCPNRGRLGRLFDLPKSNDAQFSVYLHGCLTLGDQRRCGYLDLRLPPTSSRDRFRLDSIRQGVTCPGGKVLLDNALQLFPVSASSSSFTSSTISTTTSVTSISTTTSRPPGGTAPSSTGTITTNPGASSSSSQTQRSTTTTTRTTATRTIGPPLPVPSPPGAVVGAPENEATATIPPPPPSSSNGLEEGGTEGIAPSSIALIFLSIVAALGMSVVVANFLRQRKKRATAAARRESVMSFSSAEPPTPPTLPPPLPALQHLNLSRKSSANSDEILSGIPVPGDQRITPVNLMRSIPSATFGPGGSGTLNPASMTLGRHSVKSGGFERVDGVEYIHISSLVTADEIARAPDEPLQQIVDSFESIFMQLEAHARAEIASDPSSPASSNVRTSHALETVQVLRDKRAERLIMATSSLLAKATGRPVVPGSIPDGLGAKFLGVLTAMAKYDHQSILFTVDKDERLSDHTRTARVYHIMGDVPRPTVIAATVMPGWMRSDGEVMVAVRVAAASTDDG